MPHCSLQSDGTAAGRELDGWSHRCVNYEIRRKRISGTTIESVRPRLRPVSSSLPLRRLLACSRVLQPNKALATWGWVQ